MLLSQTAVDGARLKAKFPLDSVKPVVKGRNGADLLHRVRTQALPKG
jgi:hypothetical protein